MATFDMTGPLAFALGHWLLCVLLQTENFLVYLTPPLSRRRAIGGWMVRLPFLQADNIAVSGLLGLLIFVASFHPVSRWLAFAGYSVLTAYVVLDQLYYKRFFDHLRPSNVLSKTYCTPSWIIGSVRHELDWVLPCNAVIAAAVLAILAVVPWNRVEASAAGQLLALGGTGLLLIAGVPLLFSRQHHNLQFHPILVLSRDVCRRPINVTASKLQEMPAIAEEMLSADGDVPERDDRLADVAESLRRGTHRPNVILVVLESVGGVGLFDGHDSLSPSLTPHLAEQCRNGVVFPAVYGCYPCTTYAYVPLETGGVFPTRDPDWKTAMARYRGPTLPRHFGAHGYRTALFSSPRLAYDDMLFQATQAGYDAVRDIAGDSDFAKRDRIHLWGAREERTLDQIEPWIEQCAASARPFFLTYWTCATHHPYGAPPDYDLPFPGDDLLTRYRNSIHYTDAMLARLSRFLLEHGLADNTILAVTGDHGEAFGDIHAKNYYHSTFIYEENIRTFLLLMNPKLTCGTVTSGRLGQSGDILPTLAHLAGLPAPVAPGRNLCARDWPARSVNFFTLSSSELWGLRDGTWKFIQGIRDEQAELYDLFTDPREQINIAGRHPQRVREYSRRCREWFVSANDEFYARLDGDQLRAA